MSSDQDAKRTTETQWHNKNKQACHM